MGRFVVVGRMGFMVVATIFFLCHGLWFWWLIVTTLVVDFGYGSGCVGCGFFFFFNFFFSSSWVMFMVVVVVVFMVVASHSPPSSFITTSHHQGGLLVLSLYSYFSWTTHLVSPSISEGVSV